jgi:PAS domain S-box-containing protein
MMPIDILIDDHDAKKSREQLIRELVDLRSRLAATEKSSGRKREENIMAHQQELLEIIFNNIPILLVMWDPRLQRFTLNRYAEKVIGWTTKEASEIDFMKEVYPDAIYRAEVEAFMRSLKSEWHEWNIKTKNGEYVPIHWTNIHLTDDTMIGIGVDLRERKETEQLLKQSEDRYCQLLAMLPVAMYTCDENGLITYYNEQAARLWGRSPRLGDPDELFCGSFRFYRPDGSPLSADRIPMAMVLRHGNKIRAQEINIERPDGSRVSISINIDPLRDATGRLYGAINVFTDITDHKQTEAALHRLNETLEQQIAERTEIAETRAKQLQILTRELINAEEKERQRIAMLMHDDLQQILVSAKFQTEMLTASLKDDTAKLAKTLLDTLIKATVSCRNLSHELNPSSIYGPDMGATLKKIAEQMEKNHGLRIESKIKFASDQVSEDIKIFIGRTVRELLFNCAKHAGSDQACLEISNQGDFLTVIVKDKGVGFDPNRLKIGGGNKGGIGLFGIQERTEALGGSFSFESSPNKGSQFVLKIPLKKYSKDDNRLKTVDMFKMLIASYDLENEV